MLWVLSIRTSAWDTATGLNTSRQAEDEGDEAGYKEISDLTSRCFLFPSSANKGISWVSQRKVNKSLAQHLLEQRKKQGG